MMITRKQSSRAPFKIRRDTVKLKRFLSCENKVAVPPPYPQQTTLKLDYFYNIWSNAQSDSKFLSRQMGPLQFRFPFFAS